MNMFHLNIYSLVFIVFRLYLIFCYGSEVISLDSTVIPFNDEVPIEILSSLPEDYMLIEKVDILNGSSCNANSSEDNSSDCWSMNQLPHAPVLERGRLYRAIILAFIGLASFIGNIATLYSIIKTGQQKTSTVYLLIAHLAVADLLVTVFGLLAESAWTYTVQWYAGTAMCKFIKYMQMFSLYLSTFILIVIGFDRMCAIRYPMRRANAKHYVRIGIALVWALSALLSVPQLIIFRVLKGPFIEDFFQCVTHGFYTAPWQEQLYAIVSLVSMFIIPLIILICTYVCTFCSIARSGRQNIFYERTSPSPLEDARRKIIQKAKVKSLAITVVIVLTFVVCWTPYYVMMIILIFLNPEDDQQIEELQGIIFFFGSSTAMINPLIYGAFHLRRKSKASRRSTTLNNNSSATSSRLENSVMAAFRKSRSSHPSRSSREQSGLVLLPTNTQANGTLCNGSSTQDAGKLTSPLRHNADRITDRLLEDTL